MNLEQARFNYVSKYIGHPITTFKIGGGTDTLVSGATLMCMKRGLFEKSPVLNLRSILSINTDEIRKVLQIMGGYSYIAHEIKTLVKKGDSVASPDKWLRVYIDQTPTEWDSRDIKILLNLSDDKSHVHGYVGNTYWTNFVTCNDFLQSVGIITSYTFFDEHSRLTTLTPKELISMGWATLIDNPPPII